MKLPILKTLGLFVLPIIAFTLFADVSAVQAGEDILPHYQKISEEYGNFNEETGMLFARSLAPLGDLNGDGVEDVAVGAPLGDNVVTTEDDDGAIWILFLNEEGTVGAKQKIDQNEGGFNGMLSAGASFGSSIASIGDIDGDGIVDLAVAAPKDLHASGQGSVWILFLNEDGTVKDEHKIARQTGGFIGDAGIFQFGSTVASIGDLNNDGRTEIAVSVLESDEFSNGEIWVLFLNNDGTVLDEQVINEAEGGFTGDLIHTIGLRPSFGDSMAGIGDLNGDGVEDIAVGSFGDDSTGMDQGVVWVLFMNSDGTVAGQKKIASGVNGFPDVIENIEYFGMGIAQIGDIDLDGVADLAINAALSSYTTTGTGKVWVLFMNSDGTVKEASELLYEDYHPWGALGGGNLFGSSIALLGRSFEAGIVRIAIGAPGDKALYIVDLSVTPVCTAPDLTLIEQELILVGEDGTEFSSYGPRAVKRWQAGYVGYHYDINGNGRKKDVAIYMDINRKEAWQLSVRKAKTEQDYQLLVRTYYDGVVINEVLTDEYIADIVEERLTFNAQEGLPTCTEEL